MYIVQYIVHCTMYIVHCTIHCTLYNVHCTIYVNTYCNELGRCWLYIISQIKIAIINIYIYIIDV